MAEIKELKTKAQTKEAEFEVLLAEHQRIASHLRRLFDAYGAEGIDLDKAWQLIHLVGVNKL